MTSKLYKFEITAKKFWLVLLPSLAIGTLAFATISFFIVSNIIMPKTAGNSESDQATVPVLSGISLDSAKAISEKAGFQIIEGGSEYNESSAVGIVISQNPEPGQKVKQGRHITLVVSKGTEVSEVPQVAKMEESEARSALTDAGFINVVTQYAFSSSIPKNQIVETKPAGARITSKEVTVTMVISKGAKPTMVEVPTCEGKLLSDARTSLEAIGLKVGKMTHEVSDSINPGVVIRQNPLPGEKAAMESGVSLVISIE